MGGNPINPDNVDTFRLLMITFYVLTLGAVGYAVFGIVRTAATRLPIPRGNPLDPDLFLVDITSKLYSFSGPGRKVLKIMQFTLIGVFFLAVWLDVLYITYSAGDNWFIWDPTISPWLALGIHVMIALVVVVPLGIRAYTHANRFPGLQLQTNT